MLAPAGPVSAQSSSRIVNGVLTSDFPTTGAILLGNDPDSATQWCSGTLIGCQTFLTAAHCLCDTIGSQCQSGGPQEPDPNDWLVFFQHAGFFTVSRIEVRSDFVFPVGDVAVMTLGSQVDGISPTPINTRQSPPAASAGTIVGFGRTGGAADDYGTKGFGAVETVTCSGGISNTTSVCWEFETPVGPPGDDSNSCNGDSGGPLFVDLGAGEVVAGITSGGDNPTCLADDFSFDANVYHYRSWVQTQGGSDLSNTTCGSLAQVGMPEVDVHGFSGTLSAAKPTGTHQVSVDPGAEKLIVTMHGSEESPNDFDLFVKQGAPPTTGDYDCRAFGGNNWGSCEFASPAAGTWHVLANRFDGQGVYQVTATLFYPPAVTVPALPPPALALLAATLIGAGAWLSTQGGRL